jgi:hypothetical protein
MRTLSDSENAVNDQLIQETQCVKTLPAVGAALSIEYPKEAFHCT